LTAANALADSVTWYARGVTRESEATVTDKEWKEEVERAVAGAGVLWEVRSAWIERRSDVYAADLVDKRTGTDRTVRLSSPEFPTAAERRAEIVRQLQRVR
jgi:hypothetical protein